jgi:hypothetical protein
MAPQRVLTTLASANIRRELGQDLKAVAHYEGVKSFSSNQESGDLQNPDTSWNQFEIIQKMVDIKEEDKVWLASKPRITEYQEIT